MDVLIENSGFFSEKISKQSDLYCLQISDREDVGIYVEAVGLMYCKEIKQRRMKYKVSRILQILKLIEFLKGLVGGVMFIFSIHAVNAFLGCASFSWPHVPPTLDVMALAKTVWTNRSANCSRNCNGKCHFIGGRNAFQVMES